MRIFSRTVRTPRADIAVIETGGTGMPVLMIHGNSNGKEVFLRQIESAATAGYRMIALDLPGHGQSGDAHSTDTYSIPGYADAAFDVLEALGAEKPAVLGWSLGGHIGIEMMSRDRGIRGLAIVGTPPFAPGPAGVLRAFHLHTGLFLATRSRLSAGQARRFAQACTGESPDPLFLDLIARTDPRARSCLFRSMARGAGADQRWTVEHKAVPLAVINGAAEPFARLGYLDSLNYANLWERRCHVIPDAGHAPFLDRPEIFTPLFHRFLNDVQATASTGLPTE